MYYDIPQIFVTLNLVLKRLLVHNVPCLQAQSNYLMRADSYLFMERPSGYHPNRRMFQIAGKHVQQAVLPFVFGSKSCRLRALRCKRIKL